MIDMERLVKDGFKIIDGVLRDRYGNHVEGGPIYVKDKSGWGVPATEYGFDSWDLSSYTIKKSTHYDEWYLVKNGYNEICKLRHLGGENWQPYWL